jgi:hypothetical protein
MAAELSVEEIAGLSDPVLRNLWITQRYHELAVKLRDAGAGANATWCAFAVWASKTAGASIRGDELPGLVRKLVADTDHTKGAVHRFNRGLEGWLLNSLSHDHLMQVVDEASTDVSQTIAGGNVLVFAELAPIFTAVTDAASAGHAATPAHLAKQLEPHFAALAAQGIDVAPVRAAFDCYLKALAGPADQADLVLAGNVQAVAHEQTRLQPAIATALNAGIQVAFQGLLDRDVIRHVPTAQVRSVLDQATAEVGQVIEPVWQMALTEVVMKLYLSDQTLDLRQNVPPLDGEMFPPPLATISNSDTATVLSQWDRTGGTGVPSGADDWASMDKRMNYIVNLFRSRQLHPALLTPPFTEDQLADLTAGRLPSGPL